MTENFLEEQLKRIRQMTETVSRLRNRAVAISEEIEQERALMRRSPLHEVRDFRCYSSIDEARASASDRRLPQRPPRSRRR